MNPQSKLFNILNKLMINALYVALNSYNLKRFVCKLISDLRPDVQDTCGSVEDIQEAIDLGSEEPTNKHAIITSRTIRRWLGKLGFSWKDIRKGVFFDGHEREDVVEYRKDFLRIVHDLLPYMVEFNSDGAIIPKEYPEDCRIGGPGRRPIIFITHDESIFSANDGRHQAWIAENGVFLRPKGKGQGIMVSDFLLPWKRLNIFSLSKEQQDLLTASGLPHEAVEYFEYGKNEGYWDGQKLLEQIERKAIPIAEALYPGYQFLFLFDNATSHSVYAKDALIASKMNKGDGGQQPLLRNGWYKIGNTTFVQEMFYYTATGPGNVMKVPKGIETILRERSLWPDNGLLLECPKPRCEPCQELLKCKDCVKGTRCESCQQPKVHSGKCTSRRKCDNCERRKESCKCVRKQVCAQCKERQGNGCEECDSLPPKCDTEGWSASFPPRKSYTYLFFQTVALDDYSAYNLTSKRKGLKLKRGLKRISIRFSFTQNSTVNSITLNIFGVIARDMLGNIAITLSQGYGEMFLLRCHMSRTALYWQTIIVA